MKSSIDFKKILSEREKLISARDSNLVGLKRELYRLQSIAEIRGVDFINDSRATKTYDVVESMQAISSPIVWITRSSENVTDLSLLAGLVKEKVKTVICYGRNKDLFIDQLMDETRIFVGVNDLADAVDKSSIYASAGDVVLFSPGSPAQKPYENYQERGAHFTSLVNSINYNPLNQ